MSAFIKNWHLKVLGRRCLSVWVPRSPLPRYTLYPCRWTSEKVRGALLHMRVLCRFGICIQVACLPISATFKDLQVTQILNLPLWRGEDGLGRNLALPRQGILLFCLILLSYLTYGVFFRCKLALLIFTKPSWDGYLLLYSPKSSIRGTIPICSLYPLPWPSLLSHTCSLTSLASYMYKTLSASPPNLLLQTRPLLLLFPTLLIIQGLALPDPVPSCKPNFYFPNPFGSCKKPTTYCTS
jgi:hypothetical protein